MTHAQYTLLTMLCRGGGSGSLDIHTRLPPYRLPSASLFLSLASLPLSVAFDWMYYHKTRWAVAQNLMGRSSGSVLKSDNWKPSKTGRVERKARERERERER